MKKLLCFLIVLLLLTSCSSNDDAQEASPEYSVTTDELQKENGMDYAEGEIGLINEEVDNQTTTNSAQKLIKQFNITMETKLYDEAIENLNQIIIENNAYIQNSNEYTNSYSKARTLNIVIRVPRENSTEAIADITVLGTVTNRSENVNDVTDSYSDIDARLKTLYVEEQTYLDILEKAETVDEVLKIQSYLSDTRYNIERYESQKRNYDLLISYDTLTLNIYEVEKITPVEEQSIIQEIISNFMDSVKGIGDMIRSLVVFVIGDILYIALFGLAIYLVVIAIKKIGKLPKVSKKENKKVKEEKNV